MKFPYVNESSRLINDTEPKYCCFITSYKIIYRNCFIQIREHSPTTCDTRLLGGVMSETWQQTRSDANLAPSCKMGATQLLWNDLE